MRADCHVHISLDGKTNKTSLRDNLKAYADSGVTYLRDGGDKIGISLMAKSIAGEFGIEYSTPNFAIYHKDKYGANFGRAYETEKEFLNLIRTLRETKADFAKIMMSGIMDFDNYGLLSCTPMDDYEIQRVIEISHENGFAVMAHINGDMAIKSAVKAGVDSIEHGYFMDTETIKYLADSETVWTPTLSPIANLIGNKNFNNDVLRRILDNQREKLYMGARYGAYIAQGSDGGAYNVPPETAYATEYENLKIIFGSETDKILDIGNSKIRERF